MWCRGQAFKGNRDSWMWAPGADRRTHKLSTFGSTRPYYSRLFFPIYFLYIVPHGIWYQDSESASFLESASMWFSFNIRTSNDSKIWTPACESLIALFDNFLFNFSSKLECSRTPKYEWQEAHERTLLNLHDIRDVCPPKHFPLPSEAFLEHFEFYHATAQPLGHVADAVFPLDVLIVEHA